MAKANPCRFSTKYQDDETDLLYYGYRYYSASVGKWLSRDPLASRAKRALHQHAAREVQNTYHFAYNDSVNKLDRLGLAANVVQIVTFCPRNCGPDYTEAVNDEIAAFRRYLGGGPSTDGLGALFLLGWFKNTLGSLDYAAQADRIGATADPFAGSPSKACRGTITLCRRCVGSDVPGNIMFGFASAAVGIPTLISALGADYAEATDGDGEADVGKLGFLIHAILGIPVDEDHDVFPLGRELHDNGSNDICSLLSRLPKHATSSCSPSSVVGAYPSTAPFKRIPYPKGL
jgi:RHS repeat-associated protein